MDFVNPKSSILIQREVITRASVDKAEESIKGILLYTIEGIGANMALPFSRHISHWFLNIQSPSLCAYIL